MKTIKGAAGGHKQRDIRSTWVDRESKYSRDGEKRRIDTRRSRRGLHMSRKGKA
jgi:hypothetical protein